MTAETTIPDCPICGRPLGCYYAECRICFAHAGDYSLSDYSTHLNTKTGGDK